MDHWRIQDPDQRHLEYMSRVKAGGCNGGYVVTDLSEGSAHFVGVTSRAPSSQPVGEMTSQPGAWYTVTKLTLASLQNV